MITGDRFVDLFCYGGRCHRRRTEKGAPGRSSSGAPGAGPDLPMHDGKIIMETQS